VFGEELTPEGIEIALELVEASEREAEGDVELPIFDGGQANVVTADAEKLDGVGRGVYEVEVGFDAEVAGGDGAVREESALSVGEEDPIRTARLDSVVVQVADGEVRSDRFTAGGLEDFCAG